MDETSQPNATTIVEYITPGFTREWLYNKRIVVYKTLDVSRETADAWVQTYEADLCAWPPTQPFLSILDFSEKMMTMTPYGRWCADQLAAFRPDLKGRTAIILPNGLGGTMIRLFLLQKPHATRERKTFYSRESAIDWLLS